MVIFPFELSKHHTKAFGLTISENIQISHQSRGVGCQSLDNRSAAQSAGALKGMMAARRIVRGVIFGRTCS